MRNRSLLGSLWFYAPSLQTWPTTAAASSSRFTIADELVAPEHADSLVEDESAEQPVLPRRTRALENFTTEALAGALRLNGKPILEVLASLGVLSRPLPSVTAVATQEAVPGHPRHHLDLVLRLKAEEGPASEIWVEVKVRAPVSGPQLKVYSEAMRAEHQRDGVPRRLIWLGPDEPPEKQQRYLDGWVRWQTLADEAGRARTDWFWKDFVAFLREKGMTEDSAFPISAREAAALEDGRRLFIKTHAVMLAVNDWGLRAISEWPSDHWWKPGEIKRLLFEKSLRIGGELVLRDGSMHPTYLRYGMAPQRGEAYLVVRVEVKAEGDEALRSRIVAEFGPRLGGWDRPGAGRVVLEVAERAVAFERQEDAEKWFKVQLARLQETGFYRYACSLSPCSASRPG